jgi:hypothetical protein
MTRHSIELATPSNASPAGKAASDTAAATPWLRPARLFAVGRRYVTWMIFFTSSA